MKTLAFLLFALSHTALASEAPIEVCGLSGSIPERIASCATYLRGRGELKDVQAGWSVVSQLPSREYPFRIYRDDETGRLWSTPLVGDYSQKEAAVACGAMLFKQGLRDAYPADFGLPSLEDFRVAASHKLTDAIWMAWAAFWSSDLSADLNQAGYYVSSTGKTGFESRDRWAHFFHVMKAICVSR